MQTSIVTSVSDFTRKALCPGIQESFPNVWPRIPHEIQWQANVVNKDRGLSDLPKDEVALLNQLAAGAGEQVTLIVLGKRAPKINKVVILPNEALEILEDPDQLIGARVRNIVTRKQRKPNARMGASVAKAQSTNGPGAKLLDLLPGQ